MSPMIRLLTAALLPLMAFTAGAADLCGPEPTPAADVLLVKTCAALTAVNRKNRAALDGLMAEDFALTSVSGTYYAASKAEMMDRWTEPDPAGTASRSSLIVLHRVFRSASLGFVSGVIEDRAVKGELGECSSHAFTDIWVERNGTWLWLQSHESGFRPSTCGP